LFWREKVIYYDKYCYTEIFIENTKYGTIHGMRFRRIN